MHKRIVGLAAAALLLFVADAAAAVNEPYVKDSRFGGGVVTDPMFKLAPDAVTRAGGQRLALDGDGNTVVADMSTVWLFGDISYLVIARYDANGQRMAWSHPTTGYVDTSGEYLYVMPATAPEYLYITAVRDVQVNGDNIYVLVDALEDGSDTTDSVVVTFGRSGEYKGVVVHRATPHADDVGAAILPWGSDLFLVSSTGTSVDVARYSLNLSNGVPVLNHDWGNAGSVSQSLMWCTRLVGSVPIQASCPLRGRRAFIEGTNIYIGGEYDSDASGTNLFVMAFTVTPPDTGASLPGYPIAWDLDGVDDNLRGMVFRPKYFLPMHPQNELYVLDAFQRPCGEGFVVARFNADSGAFIDRSYTKGGGTNADPNVCATTSSLMANDMALARDYTKANRYLAVVGGHVSGQPYTGMDAFLALADTKDLHSTVQVQDFTANAGQNPADTMLNAVQGDVEDGSYTVTGVQADYDHGQSAAVTMRLQADRIFRHGFDSNQAD